MLRVLQRACVRAGIEIRYSRGFNPRPKLSLPLPRPVGVESDDELLCFRVTPASCSAPRDPNGQQGANYESRIKAALAGQLPDGCELLSVSIAEANRSIQPCLAAYALPLPPEHLNESLKAKVGRLLASDNLTIRRQIGRDKSKLKTVDVRGFIKSIVADDDGLIVECKITSAGSVRVDELLQLLQLDRQKLAAPIRRTSVQWENN